MNSKTVAIITVVLFALFAAFSIPVMIDSVGDTQTVQLQLEPNEIQSAQGVDVRLNSTTETQAEVDVIDQDTGDRQTLTIAEGATEPFSLSGGDGNVTNLESTNSQATVDVTTPNTYGFSDGSQTIVEQLPLILTIIAGVVVAGGIAKVIQ